MVRLRQRLRNRRLTLSSTATMDSQALAIEHCFSWLCVESSQASVAPIGSDNRACSFAIEAKEIGILLSAAIYGAYCS